MSNKTKLVVTDKSIEAALILALENAGLQAVEGTNWSWVVRCAVVGSESMSDTEIEVEPIKVETEKE